MKKTILTLILCFLSVGAHATLLSTCGIYSSVPAHRASWNDVKKYDDLEMATGMTGTNGDVVALVDSYPVTGAPFVGGFKTHYLINGTPGVSYEVQAASKLIGFSIIPNYTVTDEDFCAKILLHP